MGLYFNIALFLLFLTGIIFIWKIKFSKLLGYKRFFIIILIMIIFFLYVNILENEYNNAFLDNSQKTFVMKIISMPEKGDYTDKYVVKIISKENKNMKLNLYLKSDKQYFYGDILKVKGEVILPDKARNDKGFNYSSYLKSNGISANVFAKEVSYLKKEKDFYFYIFKIKKKCLERIENNYDIDAGTFLKALLLGETAGLSNEVRENFSKSNLSHILAISGMHVSYVVLGLESVLKRFIKSIKIKSCIIIVFMILFCIFTGSSPSVIRSCIMIIMVYLSKILFRRNDFLTSFCIAFNFLMIKNPYNLYSISMWLSFGGTLGIVLFSNFLKRIVSKKIINKNYYLIKILESIFVSVSAQILIFPIMMYEFNTFSISFWISNLLVMNFIAPILIFGYISIFTPFKVIIIIEKYLIKLLFFITKICSSIPGNSIICVKPSFYIVLLYYIVIMFMIYQFNSHKIKYLKCILNIKYFRKFVYKLKNNFIFKIIILVITIFLATIILSNFVPKSFKINFLDVGQGDCTLIRTTQGKVILIDSGEGHRDKYDYGKNVVMPYLLAHGISKIDYSIISHFDSDHCGGMFYILENLKVENIIIGIQAEKYDNCVEFMELVRKKNVKVIALKSGDVLKIDNNTNFEVIFPAKDYVISENKINNNSLVMKLKYKDFSMLFTGDIEEEAERYLVDRYKNSLKSDFIKIAHHGSKTSSTKEFIEAVSPKVALIGVGKNNNFGHPSNITLNKLKQIGCKIYRTDRDGEITISIGKKIEIKKFINSHIIF